MNHKRTSSELASSRLNSYTVLRKIGAGLTSSVYEVDHPVFGRAALKSIEHKFLESEVGLLMVQNEI